MKNRKFLKAAVIMFTLLFAIAGIAYADNNTSKFTDIKGHWAEQHIMNVYSKGLMGGATDTQFKPGDNVKNYDALVSISRMVNREKDINLEQLETKYQASVLNKYKVPEYAREGVLICLYKGIVTDYDIGAFAEKPYATKNNISKYLGLAFGVKAEKNAPPVVLAFKDAMYVPTLYKPYVKFLIDKGIINANGDANGNFTPEAFIDRAAFAKMLDLSNTVYEKEKLGINPGNTNSSTNDSTAAGTPAPSNNSDIKDIPTTPTAPTIPQVTVETGADADITAFVDEVIPENASMAVFVGTEKKYFKVAENAACTIDGVTNGFWKLNKSDMVKLYLSNDKIIKIVGESKIRKLVGKLINIQAADKTTLVIETTSGESKSYIITAKTTVIKDGKSAMWQELKNGNSLVITTSYDELVEINADGVKSTDKGVVESVSYSRMAPPKLVITTLDGGQNTYFASKNVEISGAGNDVYSIRPGMQVEVTLIDNEVSKLTVIRETASVQAELKGMIKSVDTAAKIIIVEVNDSASNKYIDKKIFITEATNIVQFDIESLVVKSLELGSLKTSQTISIIGTASAEGVYAKTIQVLN